MSERAEPTEFDGAIPVSVPDLTESKVQISETAVPDVKANSVQQANHKSDDSEDGKASVGQTVTEESNGSTRDSPEGEDGNSGQVKKERENGSPGTEDPRKECLGGYEPGLPETPTKQSEESMSEDFKPATPSELARPTPLTVPDLPSSISNSPPAKDPFATPNGSPKGKTLYSQLTKGGLSGSPIRGTSGSPMSTCSSPRGRADSLASSSDMSHYLWQDMPIHSPAAVRRWAKISASVHGIAAFKQAARRGNRRQLAMYTALVVVLG